jgi:transcriptional regulator NrdR family protein
MNHCTAPSSYKKGSVVVEDKTDREELERRLAQAKRMAASTDAVTEERLQKLVKNLEEQLREPE